MEQNMEEKVEKLLQEFDRIGIPRERHETDVRAAINDGLSQFAVYDTFQRGDKYMDMEIRVDYNEKLERHSLTAVEAAVLNVKVPAKIAATDHFKEMEFLLQYPPSADMSQPNAQELYQERVTEHGRQITDKMQLLHNEAPEIYDVIAAKYNPITQFEPSPERAAGVEKVLQDNTVSATFSSYYRLQPAEMFNLLTVDNSYVQKRLYKKAPEGQPNNFVGWVQPKLNKVHESGVTQMKLVNDFPLTEKLLSLNLVEVVDAAKFKFLETELRQGGTMIVNNLNKTGDARISIKADPDGGSVQLTSLKTGRILPHNEFRKDPMVIIQTAEGGVVVGKKEAPEHFEPKTSVSVDRENTLQKKREQQHGSAQATEPVVADNPTVKETAGVGAENSVKATAAEQTRQEGQKGAKELNGRSGKKQRELKADAGKSQRRHA
ncbi:hypothetical protein [Chitinophaga sp. Ak27]|uniref:hypothetical protein n=1 Tax=Chitinophaga sp. Ak27 TaxID=2726116 RepID=UPI00145F5F45|nr:hypothetical protein [Chitinophaga sp. Ak27]NLU91373.1 hypothetical protein [Chitinophaga sp. Ak27]